MGRSKPRRVLGEQSTGLYDVIEWCATHAYHETTRHVMCASVLSCSGIDNTVFLVGLISYDFTGSTGGPKLTMTDRIGHIKQPELLE